MTAASSTPKAKTGTLKIPAKASAKSAAKPATTPPTKGTPVTPLPPPTPEALDPVFAEWKKGARISELVKTHTLSRAEIRRRLVKGAGSRDAFKELRKAGAGGPMTKATNPVGPA